MTTTVTTTQSRALRRAHGARPSSRAAAPLRAVPLVTPPPGFWLDEAVPGGKASCWSPGLVLPAGVARPPPEHAPQAAAPQATYRQDAPSPGAPPTLRCPAQRPYKGAAEARNSTNRMETFPVQSELCSPSLICISNDQSKCLLPTPVLLGPNCEDLDQLGTGRARSCISAASPVLGSFVVRVITM